MNVTSWSSCNRYILSSSNDWNCILWDLKDGSRVATLRFDSPVLIAHLHPTDPFKLVAIAFGDEPYVITIGQEDSLYKTITKTVISLSTDAADNVKDLMASIVRFDPKGEHIFVGTTKGLLLVCDLDGKVQLTEKITSGSSLSSLYFSHSQRCVAKPNNAHVQNSLIKLGI